MGSSEAGASSGSVYQVFLNFRGPDTRDGFTDFLYHSLTDAGIYVFRDDEELRVGEKIDGALRRAINDSRIYIPIFSRTYASSHWCLHELRQIVDNTSKSNGNKEILHIFFDVKPNDVKLKTPLYRDAILNLERRKKQSTKKVDSWREALKEVGAIKGWEAKKYKGQGELIKLVVEEVVKKLKIKQKSQDRTFNWNR
ncbi:toll/interleukin-1 receptor-like protein [Eucalyptus grandis]|uniref:toll/interleukin-1 receptor-like protein n=1 Tax=Eucalyptus grandis TaxID=71139 RepID=UPI00192EA21F|nr:toll/interleukin-1 receptor-like protein [Eucalyptus grandis]XP_039157984.1 toll/interleukin-1 receptor-like protein [Eucalyptus grandis]